MELSTLGRILIFALAVVMGVYYCRRLYQNTNRIGRAALIKLIIGASLVPLHPLTKAFETIPLWLYLPAIVSQHIGLLFVYFGFDQVENNRVHQDMKRRPLFWIVIVLSMLTIATAYVSHDNLGAFSDSESYIPTSAYYVYYFLNYFTMLVIGIPFVKLVRPEISLHKGMTFTISRFLTFCGILSLSIGVTAILLSLLIAWATGQIQQGLIETYHLGKTGLALFLTGSVIITFIPRFVIDRLTAPLFTYITHKQQANYVAIRHLHSQIVAIVPNVHFQYGQFTEDELLTEIADARLLIWTHIPHRWWFGAKDEAKVLHHLLNRTIQIDSAGNYPPAHAPSDEIAYNLRVAKYLRKMQGA
jgi:hypothetical protein